MAAFRVAEDSTGTNEARWLDAIDRRELAPPDLAPWRAAVVVSAHPDDDVLAVGDLLRGISDMGVPIRSMVVTDGERSAPESAFGSSGHLGRLRRDELRRAYEHLGIVPSITWLAIPDGHVARYEAGVGRHLQNVVAAEMIVLVPWRLDGHPDHDAVGRAAAHAAARVGATLWEFPIWTWHWADPETEGLPWSRARRWQCRDLVAKRQAIDCFATQIRPLAGSGETGPVLPAKVLERFDRPFEVVFT